MATTTQDKFPKMEIPPLPDNLVLLTNPQDYVLGMSLFGFNYKGKEWVPVEIKTQERLTNGIMAKRLATYKPENQAQPC